MKRISFVTVCCLSLLFCSVSCDRLHRDRIELSVSESAKYFKVFAHYNKSETRNVEHYLQQTLGKNNNISFINTVIDAQLTLDDGTKFYMQKHPGDLSINFNKSENSTASYIKMKDFANGLKPVVK